jgi:GT2 family glycosyltransferase
MAGTDNQTRSTIAVIVVSYNSARFIGRCLEALSKQTLRGFRTIVVDNASEDGSGDVVERKFPEVTLVRAEANLGFAGGNNLGLKYTGDAQWIALLNPDAFPNPDWLERLLAAAAAFPQFGFFGSRMLLAETPELLDGIGDVFHVSGIHWREGHRRAMRLDDREPREIFAPCAAAAMYKADILVQAGGFDEDYFCYSEDVDLGFRLRLAGHRALYVPDAVVLHVGSAITGWRSDFSVYHGQRNLVWTYVKNMPGPLAWLYLPWHLVMNLVTVGVLATRGQGRVALRAKIDALCGLPKVLRKRRGIQSQRKVPARALWAQMARGWPDRQRSSSRPLS